MNIVNGFLLIYYNMLLGYSIYFLYYSFASLNTDLPWEKCNSKWSLPSMKLGIKRKSLGYFFNNR